jgi:hypothetical protein
MCSKPKINQSLPNAIVRNATEGKSQAWVSIYGDVSHSGML